MKISENHAPKELKKKTPKVACLLALGVFFYGRGRKNRTLNTRFWRPLLYQLSYFRMATRTRLELVTSAVTGRHSNQLNHRAVCQFT